MKILYGGSLHAGEWEEFRPHALKELRTEGKITNLYPKNNNGDWIWTRVLVELGHEVIQFNYRSSFLIDPETMVRWKNLNESYSALLRALPRLADIEQKKMNRELLSLADREKPDIFFTFLGERIYPETIAALRAKNITTVLWHERNFVYEKNPNVCESLRYYDFVFTHDPGFIPMLRDLGVQTPHYLPLACYPPIHRKISLEESDYRKYKSQVSFYGTLFSGRVSFLHQILDTGVNFWTYSWNKAMARLYPALAPRYRGRARGEAMVMLLNASDIMLNPHHRTNAVTGTNARAFEAAACQTFQLAEYKPEIGNIFKIGQEIEVYYDLDDLKKKAAYYLRHPDEREEIARNAQKRAYSDHTYHHRFRRMFEVLQTG